MKKILAAVSAGIVGVIGVVFARAEGLVTAQAVADVLFGAWYSLLAVLVSWVLTALVGSRHRAWAMGSAAALMLVGGFYRWGLPPIGWLAVCFVVAVMSPYLFMVAEAVLLRFGVVLRKDAQTGAVEGIKIGDDPTVFLGGGEPEDIKRVRPEPSNE